MVQAPNTYRIDRPDGSTEDDAGKKAEMERLIKFAYPETA